jgi:DNA-binding transcriptional MerR regulator
MTQATPTYYSSSGAAQLLGIPKTSLVALESRGAIPRFERDSANRRLITLEQIEAIREYLQARRAAYGRNLDPEPETVDDEGPA